MTFKDDQQRATFVGKVSQILADSHKKTLAKVSSNKKTAQEPDFVATLTDALGQNLKNAMQSTFKNIDVSVETTFCHQSPKVLICDPLYKIQKSSEAGDLLLVYNETQDNGRTDRNAMLLQAKCADSFPHTIGNNEEHQLVLYTDWPQFLLLGYSVADERFYVRPSVYPRGGKYLLFSKQANATYSTAIAQKSLMEEHTLSEDIADFVSFLGTAGYGFKKSDIHIPGDDWSNFINRLLQHAKSHFYNRNAVGKSHAPRHICVCENDLQGVIWGADFSDAEDDSADKGLHIIEINVKPNNDDRRDS